MKPVAIRVNQSHVTHDDYGNARNMSVDVRDEHSRPQFGDYGAKADFTSFDDSVGDV